MQRWHKNGKTAEIDLKNVFCCHDFIFVFLVFALADIVVADCCREQKANLPIGSPLYVSTYGEALLSDVESRLYGRFCAVSMELSAVNAPECVGFIGELHKSTGSFGGGDREFCVAKFSPCN